MATEVRAFTLPIPAGTTQANPVTVATAFPPRIVDAIQVLVPPGPSGLVGWRVRVGGTPVIPYLSDDWIITAAEAITWPLERYPDSGAWSVQGYNTGAQDHSVYFRFLLSPTGTPANASGLFLPSDALSSVGPAGDGGA